MRITIKYEAVWQNSFLDGSNNEPLPKKGRGFVGSMKKLKNRDNEGKCFNFIERKISQDTVMGVLNRLIGDQRKLYQARQSAKYFFTDIENFIEFECRSNPINNTEIIYIRNITGSTDQNSFTGAIKDNDHIFNSDYSNELWGVLALDFEKLCEFITTEDFKIKTAIRFDPLSICKKFEKLNKLKGTEVSENIENALLILQSNFSDASYLDQKGMIKPITFYCSAIYLQISRLSQKYPDLSNALTKGGGIGGISKRGFTPKDFMNRFTTGDKKMIWGNPYLLKEKRKGVGEVTSMLTKVNGTLEILLDISEERALLLKEMIENAGVSSFYLGKKGLAYVDNIRV